MVRASRAPPGPPAPQAAESRRRDECDRIGPGPIRLVDTSGGGGGGSDTGTTGHDSAWQCDDPAAPGGHPGTS